MRGIKNLRLVGQYADYPLCTNGVDCCIEQRYYCHPTEEPMQHLSEGYYIAGTVCPASQGLASIGKAVHEVGEKEIELHHHRVYRQDDRSLTCTCGSEVEIDGHKTQRTQEDIAVDGEKAHHRLLDKHAFYDHIVPESAVIPKEQSHRCY